MSAKQCAEEDIKESLKIQGKSFLAFHSELNQIMDQLVNEQIKAQESCKNSNSK